MNAMARCFHCGDLLPGGPPIVADVAGAKRAVCCIGCKSVAEFIDGNNLGAFYRFRDQPQPDNALRPESKEFGPYDSDDLRARYVHVDGTRAETTLDIGGMYCSACGWLLENALQRYAAITSVNVNPATRRAVIGWDIGQLPFSKLLDAIAGVGFRPQPVGLQQKIAGPDLEYRIALKRLVVAAIAGMQVMMFAVALYAGEFFGIDANIERFLIIISMIATLPIVLFSAQPFFKGALRGIRARRPGMDLPVSVAIVAAFCASVWAVVADSGNVYFDSVAMFVFFLSATRFLEMRARHRSDDYATALSRLLPDTAIRRTNGLDEVIAVDRLGVGDEIVIRPGDVIPADGEVRSGQLRVDESLLTGESYPAARNPGALVCAGSINAGGSAVIRVSKTGASTHLAEIRRLLERARAERPPLAVLADRIASHFVVGVLLVATLTGFGWALIDPSRVFETVLATLVVTCPCALALATPAALAAATSRLADGGFLLVRTRILDVLRPGATLVFDKTGTLTRGRPAILRTNLLTDDPAFDEDRCYAIAVALEASSEHVLARAFERRDGMPAVEPVDIVTEPARGVTATVGDTRFRIGKLEYVAELSAGGLPQRTVTDAIRVYLGSEHGLLAEFVLGDELRADANTTIRALRQEGYRIVIASGDRADVVGPLAHNLGIDDWHAAMTPDQKVELLAKLREGGATVVMIGDGINDAPVLAGADASIAIDAGTALARASADAVILSRRLQSVVDASRIAGRTRLAIRQNLIWAVMYNVAAIPMAVTGVLSPWMAALGMSLSSLIVVLNALRLHHYRIGTETGDSLAVGGPLSERPAT